MANLAALRVFLASRRLLRGTEREAAHRVLGLDEESDGEEEPSEEAKASHEEGDHVLDIGDVDGEATVPSVALAAKPGKSQHKYYYVLNTMLMI